MKMKYEFQIENCKVQIQARRFDGSDREYRAKPRLYVEDNCESLIGNLANRTRRPYKVWKEQIAEVMDMLLEAELVMSPNWKLNWSQYAGCSCPCSPGFIASECRGIHVFNSETEQMDQIAYFDIWFTFEDIQMVDDTKEPRFTVEEAQKSLLTVQENTWKSLDAEVAVW